MVYTKMTEEDWKYPANAAYATGYLEVSKNPLHRIHWAEFGNPHGEPVIFIHGGPGGASNHDYARFFDPSRYRVILYDQRGCGNSEPHIAEDLVGGMVGNITVNLIADIEKLRIDRGITHKAHIFGGSWGSTLALAYAQAHPDRIQNLILRGIFLCNKIDLDFFYQGNAATYFDCPQTMNELGAYRAYRHDGVHTVPHALRDERMAVAFERAWHSFVSVISPDDRYDMIASYHILLNSTACPRQDKLNAALAWSGWEGVASYLNHDVSKLGKFSDPKFAIAFAIIENEYFYRALHGEDEVLSKLMSADGIAILASIPTYIVQGAHDQVCVPLSARALKDAIEKSQPNNLHYIETMAGHSMMERATNAALTNILDHLPRMRDKSNPTAGLSS